MSERFVLIVDDDDVIRRLLQLTLPGDGYAIVEARDGDHALDLCATAAPAVVVLDWRMPGRGGAEVLEELKRRHPRTPVIVLTAEQDAAPRETAERLGADVFLTKPFSPMELLGCVERLLLAGRALDKPA